MIRKLFLNDKFILGLILINAIILFIGGYSSSDQQNLVLSITDNFITILFILELFIKFKEFGINGYFNSNWNRVDFILISLSVPALISFLLQINIFDVSFLLVFRILRVFKAFRFFKFIPDVDQLVSGVQRALKASVFVLLGFVIYIFIIGILSFYLFQNSGTDYFSDPTVSLYSTFKIFTVEGWFEIPELIARNYPKSVSFFIYLYFIFVVITGGIIGLSLVNSIFVDAMVSDNNDSIEKKIDGLNIKMTEILKKLEDNET
ncbi:ion transporter [Labilibaculum sp. K2S]|uniref:ion transporter n=1 Tax=Labilibaculum sp. K2S TaxID=3056386 RepID=UPI0025A4157F|nr:ion transporter [Labilibaculum sp. K2S]MDM8159916.1 ion transporter [Labilibaculum sp. K2S]